MQQCKKCWFFKISDKDKCFCNAKAYDEKKLTKKKEPKPIKQVSDKKARQIKKGGEKEIFKDIALERSVDGVCKCEVCDKVIPLEILTHWNFDHEIPKSRGEDYRIDKKNIRIKCVGCHFKKTNGQTLKVEYSN